MTALSRAIFLTIYSKKKGSIILFLSSQYTRNIDPPSDFLHLACLSDNILWDTFYLSDAILNHH